MRTNKYFLVLIFVFVAAALCAQNVNGEGGGSTSAEDTSKRKGKPFPGFPVFLGNSDMSGGLISERTFDSLMKQGLTSRDSLGIVYQFNSFMFTYAERNLYEDSTGNLMIVTDYLSEYCEGNKLGKNIVPALWDRTKKGDTAYFDEIRLVDPSGKSVKGKAMKFVLMK